MAELKRKPIVISVYRKGDSPIFGETATHMCLDDEGGGEFIVLRQVHDRVKPGEIRVDVDELNEIMSAIMDLTKL